MIRRSLLAVTLLAALGTAASAGTYVGIGIGSEAKLGGGMESDSYAADGRSGRLILGQKFGRLAVEGSATKFDLLRGEAPYEALTLTLAGKMNFPLGDKFEAFARAGLQRTSLSTSRMDKPSYDGSGYVIGGGFEYRLDLGVAGGSVFVDYSRNQTDLSSQTAAKPLDSTIGLWTLGVTLAI